MAQKIKTYRSKDYRTFVESQPCIIDHGPCRGDVVAHHTGERGTGIKADDRSCIPLCHDVHKGSTTAIHNGKETFEKTYNVDIWRLVQQTNWAYIEYLETKK